MTCTWWSRYARTLFVCLQETLSWGGKRNQSFQKPLVTKKILTTVQAKSLFSNIENLVTVNEQFLKTLDETQRKDQVIKRIGDVFLNMVWSFSVFLSPEKKQTNNECFPCSLISSKCTSRTATTTPTL